MFLESAAENGALLIRRTTVSPRLLLTMHDNKETAGITKNESDVKRNTFKCRAVLELPTFSSVNTKKITI